VADAADADDVLLQVQTVSQHYAMHSSCLTRRRRENSAKNSV